MRIIFDQNIFGRPTLIMPSSIAASSVSIAQSKQSKGGQIKADKGRFTVNVGLLIDRFKLHLDDQMRVEALASMVRQTFSFEDIGKIYSSDFEAHLSQLRENLDDAKNMQIEQLEESCKAMESYADDVALLRTAAQVAEQADAEHVLDLTHSKNLVTKLRKKVNQLEVEIANEKAARKARIARQKERKILALAPVDVRTKH